MAKVPTDKFELVTEDIPEPVTQGSISTTKVILGNDFPPQQKILLFSANDWEAFVEEWVCYQRTRYKIVTRLSASADMGIDVAGFTDDKGFLGKWDNHQCKHYGKPLTPKTAITEIGKCIWHSFEERFVPPRKYVFVAPMDCGMSLKTLLLNTPELKKKVFEKWDEWCATSITSTKVLPLDGDLRDYAEKFDYSIFTFKPTLELIDEHRQTSYFVGRFGGGLPDRPPVEAPPTTPAATESRYLQQLLEAYGDREGKIFADTSMLVACPELDNHLKRQRVVFFHAESLRNFARDNVPHGTFEELQEEVFEGVIEVEEATYDNGFLRVNAVAQAAAQLPLTANGLISVTKIQDKKGICHQLANEDRLKWVKA